MGLRRIVLWDIDHTLIDTRGVGRELSELAFERATGLRMHRQAKIDGITESVIFRETARLHGLRTDRDDFGRFAQALTEAHAQRAADLRERGYALPGAAKALDAVAAQRGWVQTVVSGNVRAVAEIKLRTFGLDSHMLWEAGAFGEDADERSDLVALSLERAGVQAQDAVIVDDTPAGAGAGAANGVRVVAVATGRSSLEELRKAGANVVLSDLTDTQRLMAALRRYADDR
ncbi:HAD family hydrolase [Streptomyces luteireticuli]|uniref:Haloacid dehalogenase-like hydrolase n=1 Tax=Streptomyces luteireticuli TaxID=173858 RepID=A0ABN0YYS5_9ACTN